MKCLTAITAILLLGSNQVYAQNATNTDVLLGAGAGAAIGSTIGQGDGKKIATVVGALIGAQMARDAAETREYGYVQPHNFRYDRDIRRQCERMAPPYRGYPEARNAWIQGCVQRQNALLIEMQDQAYRDGLDGRN